MLYEHIVERAAGILGSFDVQEYIDFQKEARDTIEQNPETVIHELEAYLYPNIRVMASILPPKIKSFMIPYEEEYPIGYYIAPDNTDYDRFVYRCMIQSPLPYESHKFRWLLHMIDLISERDRDFILTQFGKSTRENGFEVYRSGSNWRYQEGLIKPFRSLNVRILDNIKKVRECET